MIEIKRPKDLKRLRRIALAAQGLLHAQPFGRGLSGALKAILHLGYVQIDTISVVERAHHHVLHTRVPGFRPEMINQMLRRKEIFEYWTHAAAFLPMADFRFSLPYKHALKSGQTHWYKDRDKTLMNALLSRIQAEGPIRSRDLETGGPKRAGWWDWKPSKKALEQLYMEGELMVCDRNGFEKTYDLTERVLPPSVNTQMPCMDEFSRHIVHRQMRCHGVVSLKGLTYQRRNAGLRAAVKDLVDEMLAQRRLEQIRLASGEVMLIETGALEQRLPRVGNRFAILSPFDNSVIQRDRLKALFQYDYRLECYLPAAKRRYGYFCLPLLFRDEFVGRMDCKAHRKKGRLEIKALHWEPHDFDEELIMPAFENAVKRFSGFQNCDAVSFPGDAGRFANSD
ncbi:MAG TPA: winged helix-turn-helix domain-containing protein [Desulfobacteraceae bacterium]|nr:winged helix-turn-helix domain-containing protein [Desulfobacteraceae bacterium]